MRSNRLYRCCWCLALVCLLAVPTLASDDSTFTVRSFLPTLFKDFQWKVDGNTNFQATDNDETRVIDYHGPYSDIYRTYNTEGIEHVGRANLSTHTVYEWESVQRQFSLRTGLDGRYDHQNRSEDSYNLDGIWGSTDDEIRQYRLDAIISGSARQYLVNNLFVQGDGEFRYAYQENRAIKNEYDSSHLYFEDYHTPGQTVIEDQVIINNRDRFTVRHDNRLSGKLTVGWGRLYHGEYASTALYIIDELRNAGLIVKEPSYEDMYALTKLVYENRLALTPDERWHTIDAMHAIVKTLSESGALAQAEGHATAIIADVWEYFPRSSRLFGWDVRVSYGGSGSRTSSRLSSSEVQKIVTIIHDTAGVTWDTATYSYTYSQSGYSKTEPSEYYVSLAASWSRPLDARHYINLDAVVQHDFDTGDDVKIVGSPTFTYSKMSGQYSAEGKATFRYLYDERTDFSIGLSIQYLTEMRDYHHRTDSGGVFVDTTIEEVKTRRTMVNAGIGGTYRISVSTDIGANLNLAYDFRKEHELWNERSYSDVVVSLSARFTHYIF